MTITTNQTQVTFSATPIGSVARLLERAEYAEALAAERYYSAVASAHGEAIARGRSPRATLALIERERPAVVIDGAPGTDDIYLDASQLRDALSGLPRNATVRISTGRASDPVVIEATNGTTLATVWPLAIDGFEPLWPSVARQDWGQ